MAEHDAKHDISQSFQCSSFRDVVRFESHIGLRCRNVDVDASMGQSMNRMAKVAGSKEGRRIERIGRLVLLGKETIESFECWHAFTRVMQTKQVRAMYELNQLFRFQLVLQETLNACSSDD